MNRWVIFTALFGDYDRLAEPKEAWPGFDFVCFTDQKGLSSEVWGIVQVEGGGASPVELNRMYKMLPHRYLPQYEASLYLDSNIEILQAPLEIMENGLKDKLLLLARHSLRNCIYEEARECVIFKKSGYRDTLEQVARYRREGFPEHYGMSENGVLFRKHNHPLVKSLMEQWWSEFLAGSRRDQLSLPYVFWTNGLDLPFGQHSVDDDENFRKFPHKREVRSPLDKMKLSLEIRTRRLYYSLFGFK